MPPLSFVDKLIYWFLMLLSMVLMLGWFAGTLLLRDQIAFRDEMVIAVDDHYIIVWALVPCMTFFIMAFALLEQAYQSRKPIFGVRNFQYGPPKWPKEYPLFMKNKPPVFISERKQKERKQQAVFLLAVLLISLIPYPRSLFGRDCLNGDGSIVQYNMFNGKAQEFSPGEIESVQIETHRITIGKRAKSRIWSVRMVFTTDSGKEYSFLARDFRYDSSADIPYWLTAMLQVKRRYDPGIITYSGEEYLEKVVSDKNLTEAETQLLYELFGQ